MEPGPQPQSSSVIPGRKWGTRKPASSTARRAVWKRWNSSPYPWVYVSGPWICCSSWISWLIRPPRGLVSALADRANKREPNLEEAFELFFEAASETELTERLQGEVYVTTLWGSAG